MSLPRTADERTRAMHAEAAHAVHEAFRGADSNVLLALVQGLADPKLEALPTLADRSLDATGRFIGRQAAWEAVPV
ncbi:hypothetical protein K8O61_17240 [Xanthomonas cerealis pv. cerealis]|uniref:hypothetical protein n=1 Tax=Xanthomonas cerealis TaxID=3390025 RepID=UPI001F2A23E7|nr:hypothetical protein [Xanthomonas translucens]UKE69164.1 hypothetical protein K8O61_17240 [Xanthomonas translucens pv. pistacia]